MMRTCLAVIGAAVVLACLLAVVIVVLGSRSIPSLPIATVEPLQAVPAVNTLAPTKVIPPTSNPAMAACEKALGGPIAAGKHCIEYILESDGGADVTYSNVQGGTEQMRNMAAGPLYTFTADPGAFLYLSVQAQSGNTVGCTIKVDGAVYKHSASQGQYTIADCSGLLP